MNSKVVPILPKKKNEQKAVSYIVGDGEIIISQITETGTETVALNIEQARFVMSGFDELLAQEPGAS